MKRRIAAGEYISPPGHANSPELADIAPAGIFAMEAHGDPLTLNDAMARPDWPQWREAMNKELATLEHAHTWDSVPRPPGKNIISSKWVFRIKRKADGSIEKYKARLVARGFTQIYGIDYSSMYSPVAKLTSIRFVLAMAARCDWDIDTFDFNGAYLNGQLEPTEELYMESPPGSDTDDSTVKRLRKSLYGLKQAGRRWYDTLLRALRTLGFRITDADPGVFYAHTPSGFLVLTIHVDDCILTGTSCSAIAEYKSKIHALYPITDLGPIHWLLGIQVTRNRAAHTISLSQTSYVDTILRRFSLSDARSYNCPMVPGALLTKDHAPKNPQEEARMKKTPYREAIGSLMYLAVATRPNISFAVSALSQFLTNLGVAHWEAVKRVF